MELAAYAISAMIILQALLVVSAKHPLSVKIHGGAVLGTNGIALRFLWSVQEGESIAWDVVDSGLRYETTGYYTFVQIPLHYVFLGAVLLGAFARWRRNRMIHKAR